MTDPIFVIIQAFVELRYGVVVHTREKSLKYVGTQNDHSTPHRSPQSGPSDVTFLIKFYSHDEFLKVEEICLMSFLATGSNGPCMHTECFRCALPNG